MFDHGPDVILALGDVEGPAVLESDFPVVIYPFMQRDGTPIHLDKIGIQPHRQIVGIGDRRR